MFKFIQRFKNFWYNMQLLQYLDTNAFESCVDIMEKVYPGYKTLLSNLIDRHQISIVKKVFAFINENGGPQKLADYYNNADSTEKQSMIDAFNKAFKQDAAFEEKVLLLTKLSHLKGFDLLANTLGDVKDNVVVGSIQSGQRTLDDWKAFVRHEQERGSDFKLGILDQIESQAAKVPEVSDEPKEVEAPNITLFPDEILDQLYEYNGTAFLTLPSLDEFKRIIVRGQHTQKLTPCPGKTAFLYLIIYRLSLILPKDKRSIWYDDILKECGFEKETVRKKASSALESSNDATRKMARRISDIFDDYLKSR